MQKDLTIIILTYNSAQVVANCLKKLNFEKYKVVVIDNASSDNSLELVKTKFPKIEIIVLPKNIGYGNGNNAALKIADTEFALILNPDAMIFEKDIEIVLQEMRKNPMAAMAGPIVLDQYPKNGAELEKKISYMEKDFSTIKDCYYEKIGNNYSVRFLIGAALFMNISLMKKIGFFDEKIFLFYEDDELCGRVRAKGYQNIVVPNAVAFHVSGGGKSSGSSLKVTYKKSWHLTWSKLYWKKLRKGNLRAKRSAFKFILVYLVKTLFFALSLNRKEVVKNFGATFGAFSFFIGLEAFDGNGNSRGNFKFL